MSFSEGEKQLIRTQLMRPKNRQPTDAEVDLFIATCERRDLDPFGGHIYTQFRWSSQVEDEVMSIEATIDGLRLLAERTGKYLGQTPVHWCGTDGVWYEAWLQEDPPSAARVGVYKAGRAEPTYHVATYAEYKATNNSGQVQGLWRKGQKPATMTAKCAEAGAIRRAFPGETAGLYTPEEMERANAQALAEARAAGEESTSEPDAPQAAVPAPSEEPAREPQAPAPAPASQGRVEVATPPAGANIAAASMVAETAGPENDPGVDAAPPAVREAFRATYTECGFTLESVETLSVALFGQRHLDRLDERQMTGLAEYLEAGKAAEWSARAFAKRAGDLKRRVERATAEAVDPEGAAREVRAERKAFVDQLLKAANEAAAAAQGA